MQFQYRNLKKNYYIKLFKKELHKIVLGEIELCGV